MRIWLSVLLILLAKGSFAQYPFEKFPAIKCKEYKGWMQDTAAYLKTDNLTYCIVLPHFFGQESLTVRAVLEQCPKCDYLKLYKGKKFLQRLNMKTGFNPTDFSEPFRVADFNGDSLKDLKLVTSYHGCGLAAMNVRVLYLFQQPGGKFTKIEYMDKTDDSNTPERDMDGDGNYEIITMDLQNYQTHNYWTFNSYNFKNNRLVNVNEKFDYPVMVQYLYQSNYTPASFNKNVLKKFSLKRPPEYDVK